MSCLNYGDASDTWSANPVSCAAVLATLDEFETTDVLKHAQGISQIFFRGLTRLQETSLVKKIRGEGMVFGIECGPVGNLTADQVANVVVETCYLGKPGGDGIHFLGPLAGCVLRVAPPLTMTSDEAEASLELLFSLVSQLELKLRGAAVT
jgi:4-aminobutyrate aminotransferase-like enzyme